MHSILKTHGLSTVEFLLGTTSVTTNGREETRHSSAGPGTFRKLVTPNKLHMETGNDASRLASKSSTASNDVFADLISNKSLNGEVCPPAGQLTAVT